MSGDIYISGKSSNNKITISGSGEKKDIDLSTKETNNNLATQNNNAKYYSDKALESANKAVQSANNAQSYVESVIATKNELLNNENFINVSENLEVINTVGESIENVNYVGENIEEINQLVGDLEALGDTTNIEIVASNIDNINSLAEDIQTVEENKNIVLEQTTLAQGYSASASENAYKTELHYSATVEQYERTKQERIKTEEYSRLSYLDAQDAKEYSETAKQQANISIANAEISITQAGNALKSAENSALSEANAKESENKAKASETNALNSANVATQQAQIAKEEVAKLSTVYKYKGSVATINNLPTNANVGDVYDTQETGMNYAWNGTEWDELGGTFDVSWGSLKGSISDNTDLQTALNSKVGIANAETITGAKTFTQPIKIQNGAGTGSLLIGADVNASTLNNGTRKLARIAVPTQTNKDLMATLLGFDSNGDDALHIKNRFYDAISFGGQTKITNATSPMSLGFCVTKTRNSTSASDKVYTLEMDANEARFNVQPNYNGVNLATTVDITSALANYALKSDIVTYTAGQNITIENGVISASGGGSVDLTGYIKNQEALADSVAIAIGNTNSSYNSTAVGVEAKTGRYATALGRTAMATGEYSVAVGRYADAQSTNSVAIGNSSSAWYGGVALGGNAKAQGSGGAIAIGGANASGGTSIAIGWATASASNAIQLGQGENSKADTFQVKSFQMLDFKTGKIPSERLPEMESKGGLPIGTILPVTASSSYIPEGTLYCDGAEKTSAEYPQLWDDYLTGKVQAINDYIQLSLSTNFKAVLAFRTGVDITTSQELLADQTSYQNIFVIADGKMKGWDENFTEIFNEEVSPNTVYYVHLKVQNQTLFGALSNSKNTPETYRVIRLAAVAGEILTIQTSSTATTVLATSTINGNALYSNNVYNSAVENIGTQKITEVDAPIGHSLLDTCTYSEYQTELTMTGQCIRWAVDVENQKFRIPLIKDGSVIQQAGVDSIGKSFNAGLPNVEGELNGVLAGNETSGAFTVETTGKYNLYYNTNNTCKRVTFDASNSNSIYGNSYTVQMNAVAVRHFVVVATGSINDSQRDWNKYESGLNGKANNDLSNCTRPYIIEVSDKSLLPSWYRIYSDGWCEQGGRSSVATATTTITLLKSYVDANYSLSMTGSAGYPWVTSRTVSSFVADTSAASTVDWEAKGYIN